MMNLAPDPWIVRQSDQDSSVNFIKQTEDRGYLEARFVQRDPSYFIVYLSSHTGCRHACRFCHLTATGQTMMRPTTSAEYIDQASRVLAHYSSLIKSRPRTEGVVHFNFMARGEALSNPYFTSGSQNIFDFLSALAETFNLQAKFLVSTIIPKDFNGSLARILADPRSTPYYSLYSVNHDFRRRWLPNAKSADAGLDLMAEYQSRTGREIVIHGAFIAGQNDSDDDVLAMIREIKGRGLRARFNLVRYNPYDVRSGEEPDDDKLQAIFDLIQREMPHDGNRIVPRVGFDVQASCGMFVR